MYHHRIQHLCRCDDYLSCLINLLDDPLLDDRHTLKRDLNTHIAARHHDPVSLLDDRVNIVHALLILDLCDDIDGTASVFIKKFSHLPDIIRSTGEGCSHKIKIFLDSEKEIFPVLRADERHVQLYSGHIDALAVRDISSVVDNADDILPFDLLHLHPDQAIVDQNRITDLHVFIKIFIGNGHALLSSLNLIIHKCKFLSLLKRDPVILEAPDPDLRSLRVQKSCDRSVILLPELL